MKTMRNELIAFGIISCIVLAIILTIHPLDELRIKDFGGLFGIIGFVVIKKMVDIYFAKRDKIN